MANGKKEKKILRSLHMMGQVPGTILSTVRPLKSTGTYEYSLHMMGQSRPLVLHKKKTFTFTGLIVDGRSFSCYEKREGL
jgi:hypothetical protein